MIGIIVLIYGVVLGSFYNVVIYRLPLGKSVVGGRSFCPACQHKLAAKDLIPVFSQLSLKNRCRYCSEKISVRYPIIELLTGFLFFVGYHLYGLSWEFFTHAVLCSMLLITALIDYDHKVIMDSVLLVFSIPMVFGIVFRDMSAREYLLGAAAGFGAYLAIYLLARLMYKKEAFGFGDVLLMGTTGLFLGSGKIIVAAIMPFYIALAAIIAGKLLGKKVKRKDEIPFGPFICMAAYITSIFGNQITDFFGGILL